MKQAALATMSFLLASAIQTGSAQAQPPDDILESLLPKSDLRLQLMGMEDVDDPSILHTGEWIVPPETVERFKMIFVHYLWMPYIFEEFSKRNDANWRVALKGALSASQARCTADLASQHVEHQAGWDTWEVALFTAAGIAVGLGFGFGFGFAAAH